MRRIRVFFCVWMVTIGCLWADGHNTLAGTEPARVLLISSYHPGFPTFFQQVQGIKTVFSRKGIVLDVEFMDKKRFADAENEAHFLELLSYKISRIKPYDAVMTADDDALLFLLKHKENLFPFQPAVFLGVNDIARAREQNGRKGITGVIEAVSMKDTVQMMLDFLPKTEKVLALVDTTPSSVGDVSTFRTLAATFPHIAFAELSLGDLTFAEFGEALQKIDDKTAVLLLSAYVDREGARMLFGDSLRLILDNLHHPLFHLWYHGMGDGMMGGKVISHEQQGKTAAELVLRILAGEPAESIQVIEESPNVTIVDYNVLRKFGLEKRKLPDDVMVLNNPSSFYERYKFHLWLGIIFLISQTLLILFLLNMVRRNRKTECSLRESEARTRAISDAAIDAIIILDHQGLVTYWNPAAERIFGYTREEISGKNLHLLLAPQRYQQLHDTAFAVFQDTGQGEAIGKVLELEAYHKDGHEISIELSLSSLQNQEDWHAIGIVRDITDRKQAEAALLESEARFKALHNASFGGIAIHDKGIILECNQGLVEISGYTEDELIGMDGLLLIAPGSRDPVMQKILSGYEKPYEAIGLRKNGEEYPLRLEARNIPYKGNQVRSVEFRDITEAKKAEAERQRLQDQILHAQKMEAIGTLAGGIAHDFNNILGAILGYAEMAKEDSAPGSKAADELDKVMAAGNRAAGLVKQILAFSRQTVTEPVPVNPEHIVLEAIKLLRPSLPSTIVITQQLASPIHTIVADPNQIHQIVMNLCTNAFHAMEQTGGTLDISLENRALVAQDIQRYPDAKPGNFVVLSIRDTGPGIPSEIRDRIFDPYFTTKEVGKGTGMGLAIVHGIVSSLGGCITCESTLGQGTVFRIFLPATPSDDIAPPSVATELIPGGKEHVLYVDDEEALAELGKTMLERLGYHVTLCTDSMVALSLIQENPGTFDMLVTDQTMPGMTGFDLARKALQMRPNLPIILCTGYSNLVDEETAKQAGIRGFIMKPLTKKGLAEILAKVKHENNLQTKTT